MTDFALITDKPAPAVRSLAAKYGFNDTEHRGELAQIFDGRGRSVRFLRRAGVSLDAFGEILWDRGVTHRRLAPTEVAELLGMVFDATGKAGGVQKHPSARQVTKAEDRARKNRSRKYQCPTRDCRQIARGTRNSLLVCGCCLELSGRIVYLELKDALPEQIREQAQ